MCTDLDRDTVPPLDNKAPAFTPREPGAKHVTECAIEKAYTNASSPGTSRILLPVFNPPKSVPAYQPERSIKYAGFQSNYFVKVFLLIIQYKYLKLYSFSLEYYPPLWRLCLFHFCEHIFTTHQPFVVNFYVPAWVPGLPIRDCARTCNNRAQSRSIRNAIDVTGKTFF